LVALCAKLHKEEKQNKNSEQTKDKCNK